MPYLAHVLFKELCNVTRSVIYFIWADRLGIERVVSSAAEFHQYLVGLGQNVRATLGSWKVFLYNRECIFVNVQNLCGSLIRHGTLLLHLLRNHLGGGPERSDVLHANLCLL